MDHGFIAIHNIRDIPVSVPAFSSRLLTLAFAGKIPPAMNLAEGTFKGMVSRLSAFASYDVNVSLLDSVVYRTIGSKLN